MGRNSKIEWTEDTWNPITGCSKVSQGCKNCYAEREWPRYAHLPAYKGRAFTDIACHPERLVQPLHWTKPRKVFVNSVSDLFHEDVPFEFIDKVFAVMALANLHTFQVLTKRPARMLEYLAFTSGTIGAAVRWLKEAMLLDGSINSMPSVLPNVWLGVSVENQAAADERIPLLLQTPAAVRWLSMEPLLGPVDLCTLPSASGIGRYLDALCNDGVDQTADIPHKLDWVVVGGESGRKARPMHPEWVRALRDECAAAGVPFLFKQWGEWLPMMGHVECVPVHGPKFTHCDGTIMGRAGKKAAGRLLDGAQHDGYPE